MRILLVVFLTLSSFAAARESASSITLDELKLEKRFGIGLSAGGGFAVMGLEGDVNVTESWSISGGIGTGMDFNTFNVKARYYLLGKSVSPYIGVGFARWWTDGTKDKKVSPSVLANRFLEPGEDPTKGFSMFLLYPAVGVQYLHWSGFSFSAELQYLFKLFNFANGTYAGLSAHWYF